MSKFFERRKIIFEGLLGILMVQPLIWIALNRAFGPDVPIEFLIGAMVFLFVVSFWFFCACITPDGQAVKPRWW